MNQTIKECPGVSRGSRIALVVAAVAAWNGVRSPFRVRHAPASPRFPSPARAKSGGTPDVAEFTFSVTEPGRYRYRHDLQQANTTQNQRRHRFREVRRAWPRRTSRPQGYDIEPRYQNNCFLPTPVYMRRLRCRNPEPSPNCPASECAREHHRLHREPDRAGESTRLLQDRRHPFRRDHEGREFRFRAHLHRGQPQPAHKHGTRPGHRGRAKP